MLSLLLMSGCGYESMAPSWLIDRTRILAVQAEVAGQPGLAEPRPGDFVTFRSLTANPVYGDFAVTWMGCLPDEASSFGCDVDIDAVSALFEVDLESLTNEELLALLAEAQEAGFLGFEPYFSPFLQVPEDVLDGLEEDQKLEGIYYFLTLSAFPLEEDDQGELVDVDVSEDDSLVELAYKRMPVSEATTPNHNPEVTSFQVDDYPVAADQLLHVTAGQTYTVNPVLGETALEEYRYVASDGTEETRIEEPYFTFYATGGGFDYNFSLLPNSSVEWTAPDDPDGTGHRVWVVVRDRRGGMGWWTMDVVVDHTP